MRPAEPATGRGSASAPWLARCALAVWALVAVLAVAYAGELRWAASALPRYLRHEFPPLLERLHAAEALRVIEQEQDVEEALVHMEASAAIDPNAFPFLHAELERRAGRSERALALYERATRVDPTDARAWLRRADLLVEVGQPEEARRVLREGLAWFTRNQRLFRPVSDPAVPPAYNAKAERSYQELLRASDLLRAALAAQARSSRPAAPGEAR